jgi:hypothetical protein
LIIGDADHNKATPSPAYSNFFASGDNPHAPHVFVESVERKLEEHTEKQALGKPIEKNKTVKAVIEENLACQGKLIQGDGNIAFNEAVGVIRMMLEEGPNANESNIIETLAIAQR